MEPIISSVGVVSDIDITDLVLQRQSILQRQCMAQQRDIETLKQQLATLAIITIKDKADQICQTETEIIKSDTTYITPHPPKSSQVTTSAGVSCVSESNYRTVRPISSTFRCNKLRNGSLPRECSSAIVYENNVYLYGGTNGSQIMNDVWQFDTTTENWSRVDTNGTIPLPRYAHTAVQYKSQMWVFGGYGVGGQGIPTAKNTGTVSVPSSVMINTGGGWVQTKTGYQPATCGLLSTLYVLDLVTWKWRITTPRETPPFLKGHSAIVYKNLMYIFGGCMVDGRSNLIIVFDMDHEQWMTTDIYNPQIAAANAYLVARENNFAAGAISMSSVPAPCSGHSAVLHKDKQGHHSMIVYGGRISKFDFISDVYKYNLDTNFWQKIPNTDTNPPARAGHSATIYHNSMIIFGGYVYEKRDKKTYFNDVHILDLNKSIWRQVTVNGIAMPMPRCGHSSVIYESSNAKSVYMMTFGGWGELSAQVQSTNRLHYEQLQEEEALDEDDKPIFESCNNDTFQFTIAYAIQKPNKLPPIATQSNNQQNINSDNVMNQSMKTVSKQPNVKAFAVPTKVGIPPVPPMEKPNKKIPYRRIMMTVERLYDPERLQKRKEDLEKKYIQERERNILSLSQEEECTDRLFYQAVEDMQTRHHELEKKYNATSQRVVLPPSKVNEMVDRLSRTINNEND